MIVGREGSLTTSLQKQLWTVKWLEMYELEKGERETWEPKTGKQQATRDVKGSKKNSTPKAGKTHRKGWGSMKWWEEWEHQLRWREGEGAKKEERNRSLLGNSSKK
jgi:hypothetical protein